MSEQQMINPSKTDALIQQLINLIDPEGAGVNIDWDKARGVVRRWSGDGMNRLPLASVDALLDEIEAISSKHGGRELYRAAVQRWQVDEVNTDLNPDHVDALLEEWRDIRFKVRMGQITDEAGDEEMRGAVERWAQMQQPSACEHGVQRYVIHECRQCLAVLSAPPPSPKTDAAFQDALYCPSPVETARCDGCGAMWPSCVCPAADEPEPAKNINERIEHALSEARRWNDECSRLIKERDAHRQSAPPPAAQESKPAQDVLAEIRARDVMPLDMTPVMLANAPSWIASWGEQAAKDRRALLAELDSLQSAPPPANPQSASIFDEPSQRVEGELISAGVIDESNFPAKPDESLEVERLIRALRQIATGADPDESGDGLTYAEIQSIANGALVNPSTEGERA